MRPVAITVTPSTQKLEITSGKLVWGDQHAVTVTNGDGADWDDRDFVLAVKRSGRWSDDALTSAGSSSVVGTTATVTLNLNVDAIKSLLGDQDDVTCLLEFGDDVDSTYGSADVPIRNRARRPSDTVPADSDPSTEDDGTVWVVIDGAWEKQPAVTESDTEPSTTWPGQLWLDTSLSPNLLKLRLAAGTWLGLNILEPVLPDRTLSKSYRLFFDNSNLDKEEVS